MTAKKKETRVLAIVISVVVAIITVFVGKYLVFKHVMTNAAITYLSDKYSVEKEEYQLIDYEQARWHLLQTDSLLKPYTLSWFDYQWQFKYNDREFFVTKIDGVYYDDYQLEDVTQWATEWFKSNISDDIIVPGYSTQTIINFQKSFGLSGNEYVFTKENIFDFISSPAIYESKEDCVLLYCYSPDISPFSPYEERKTELNNKIGKILPEADYLTNYSQYKMCSRIITDKDFTWYRVYGCSEYKVYEYSE